MIFSTSHRKNNTISSRIWKYMVSLSCQGVSLSAVWTFDKDLQVVPVSPPPTPAVWTMDMQGVSVSTPQTPAVSICRVYQFHHHHQHQQYGQWTCRVYQFRHHQHQQYGHAGCISFTTANTSSIDLQGISVLPPPLTPAWTRNWTCRPAGMYPFTPPAV
jgi:hypothetical protein